jgi:predicted transcriptional regulator
MKTFTFKYDPHPARSAIEGIRNAMKYGKGEIHSDSLSCRTMQEMVALMTKGRLDAFTAIVEQEPNSITELANLLGKDAGNVQRDVASLEALGLVALKRQAAKRGVKIKPVARYQRIVFECEPKKIKNLGRIRR